VRIHAIGNGGQLIQIDDSAAIALGSA